VELEAELAAKGDSGGGNDVLPYSACDKIVRGDKTAISPYQHHLKVAIYPLWAMCLDAVIVPGQAVVPRTRDRPVLCGT
jgi:hypothetical protein